MDENLTINTKNFFLKKIFSVNVVQLQHLLSNEAHLMLLKAA